MGLSIALAQLNPTVGDVAGNLARVRSARDRAAELGADLLVLSELVLVGYPPEDLVLRPALVDAAASALRELERESAAGSLAVLVTLPWRANGCLYNAVALVADGRSELQFKHELPNYGVFDEKRIFKPGPLPAPIVFRGVRLGVPICEDIWFPTVTAHLARAGRHSRRALHRTAQRRPRSWMARSGPPTREPDGHTSRWDSVRRR